MERPFFYQEHNAYFAQLNDGLEKFGADELASLGAYEVNTVYRGIHFKADRETLYRINYQSRLCSRIMAPLRRFSCHSTKYLYQTALAIPWDDILSPETTFAISANVSHSAIGHSQYAALCLKDAIADHFRRLHGRRPSVDARSPDIRINLHVDRNLATISLDTSGEALHRRQYRRESVEAPMQETLAAAIIRLSGWSGEQPLVDPMCGSGTLLCEALMHICRIPAGYLRTTFGFEFLPDFDSAVWRNVRDQADRMVRPPAENLISGGDISAAAIRAAQTNLATLPGGNYVRLNTQPFDKTSVPQSAIIVCNPPHGIRLGGTDETALLLKNFGDFLKQSCSGTTAFIYFGSRDLIKRIGLRPTWKEPLKSGGQDGILARYDMY